MKSHRNLIAAVALATLAFAACRSTGPVVSSPAAASPSLPPALPTSASIVAIMTSVANWQLTEMASRVAPIQRPDGYWRVSLLNPDAFPVPETSGTGFFTYAQIYGVGAFLLAGSEVHRLARAR